MKWTLYNKASGAFSAIVTGPDGSCLVNHISDEVGAIEGRWDKTLYRVENENIISINEEE